MLAALLTIQGHRVCMCEPFDEPEGRTFWPLASVSRAGWVGECLLLCVLLCVRLIEHTVQDVTAHQVPQLCDVVTCDD